MKNLEKAMMGTIQAITLTVERRDPYTAGHQRRVSDLAVGIDKALEEIEQNKGALYDRKVVDACLKIFKENKFEFE